MQNFINLLKNHNEIKIIDYKVNPELEISEITDRVFKSNGPALLFMNTGYDFPVLTNIFGTEKRLLLALKESSLNGITDKIDNLFKGLFKPNNSLLDKFKTLNKLKEISNFFPKKITKRGICQEVIINSPDLNKIPIIKCWPYDGGKFITLPLVHTINPETNIQNLGMYRMQLFNGQLTGMHWHKHKSSARYYELFKQRNTKMPISVALGGNPIYTYAATAPLPDGVDEYILAGFLNKQPVKLVKCITNDLYIPEDCDFVIEGYVDVNEDLILEGPFGDHTGFYSLADFYPKFHITCITHKKNAIYPTTIVGIPPQEDALLGKATEKLFLPPIKFSISPEIEDLHMPVEGVFHNLVIVKINKSYPGQSQKVVNALLGAGQMMFAKIIVVVNNDVDITNYKELAQHIIKNVDIRSDLLITKGPMDVLDHSSVNFAFGGKLAIDATIKFSEEKINKNSIDKDNISSQDINNLKTKLKEYKINCDLLSMQLPIVFIFIEKKTKNYIDDLNDNIKSLLGKSNINCIIYMDKAAEQLDISDLFWLLLNNIDPIRDIYKLSNLDRDYIFIDSTSKNSTTDNFSRLWPNVIVSDNDTIHKIDDIWAKLNLGDFIESPSLKYKCLVNNPGATKN
ncbi:MAG: menaquinone biosynthesis decarboxylase [Solitalea-like symbiont of Tyrophagus putrescentiae]